MNITLRALYAILVLNIGCVLTSLAAKAPESLSQVQIDSDPAGAEVWIDRELRGQTPLTITDLLPGEHLLQLRKADYMEATQTLLVDAQGRRIIETRLEPITGLVLIHTQPTGAEITIDGVSHGRTPALVTTIPIGTHRIKLQAQGFQPKEIELRIADRTPQRMDVDLQSDSGTLIVRSQPENATVLIDGIERGKTPCTITRIPEGEVELRVESAGHAPVAQKVRLRAGEQQTAEFTLLPQPATLRVVSIPEKARVYIDNQFCGETPLIMKDMLPRTYRLRAELAGHDILARDVMLERGAMVTEEFRLEANTGRMEVVSEPPQVTVTVDGQVMGKTTGRDLGKPSDVLALTVQTGEREVRFSAKGYHDLMRRVTISRGKTTPVSVLLARRFEPNYEVITELKTYRGMLVSKDVHTIRIEIAPGVITPIPMAEVKSHGAYTP